MPESLHQVRQPESADLDAEFCESIIDIDGETFCYLTVPPSGCKKRKSCCFCAFKGAGIPGMKIDDRWREAVGRRVTQSVAGDIEALFITNDGNMFHPAEMHPGTILEDVPRAVAGSSTCNALEFEVGVEYLLLGSTWEKLQTIRQNLSGKELRVRVGVEYADNELLARNLKEVTMQDVDNAVSALSSTGIPWIGYAMFGGVEMTSEEAKQAAIQTGKFIMNRGARRLALNGLFVTEDMKAEEQQTGRRLYVPTMEDLLEVLEALSAHRISQSRSTPIKVGLDEVRDEDRRVHAVQYPYGIPVADPQERNRLMSILSDFDRCQTFETFQVEVMRNWAKTEASQCLHQ